MTTTQTTNPLGDLWKTMLAWGVLNVILGVAVLAWPGISILAAAVLFGAFLVISGIAQVAAAFARDVSAGSRVMLFISGALSVVLGVLAFRHFGQGYAVLLLAIWIGVGFIFQGVAEAVVAISHPLLPARGWHIFLGILTVIAGIVVMVGRLIPSSCWRSSPGHGLSSSGSPRSSGRSKRARTARTVEHGIERLTSPA